jgi:hypothetical protein
LNCGFAILDSSTIEKGVLHQPEKGGLNSQHRFCMLLFPDGSFILLREFPMEEEIFD